MGYPIEIANSMPNQPQVPVQDPVTRRFHGWRAWLRLQLSRRKRTRADFPSIFGLGPDRRHRPLRPSDAQQLDLGEIQQRLEAVSREAHPRRGD